jgi:hypothetical protein
VSRARRVLEPLGRRHAECRHFVPRSVIHSASASFGSRDSALVYFALSALAFCSSGRGLRCTAPKEIHGEQHLEIGEKSRKSPFRLNSSSAIVVIFKSNHRQISAPFSNRVSFACSCSVFPSTNGIFYCIHCFHLYSSGHDSPLFKFCPYLTRDSYTTATCLFSALLMIHIFSSQPRAEAPYQLSRIRTSGMKVFPV